MFDFLSQKISSIFTRLTGQDRLTEKNIDETLTKVQDSLLEADVPYDVVEQFIAQIKHEVVGQKIFASLKPAELLMKIVHDKVIHFLGGQASETQFAFQMPATVMMIGLQGSGKTTTIAKLVNFVQEQAQKRGKARRIMVGSVDFYRPAAIDQLEILAKQVGALFYRSSLTDPVAAAQDILKHSQQEQCDLLFLDTAGRLHVDTTMLEELHQIDVKVKPKYKLLVVDAMTGQESLKVAQAFEQKIGFLGAILSKMDSDTRGGVAFAFKYALKKPILFIGTGEKIDDLELFRPERLATRIIGMGDIKSLIEKAQEKIKVDDQEAMYKSLSEGKLTLQDFAQQIEMVSKLGSLSSVLKYLPGAGSLNISPEMIQKGETEIIKFKAIINSMTSKERLNPKVLDASRKNRVAQGSGVTVADINTLLSRFEQSQQFVKVFKKMGKSRFF
ncbi:signal recognition particle protein [Candidatus Dependentiae bacterium]|nr:signal recognition particle protein [Candidatus Dependentiae bacterium]